VSIGELPASQVHNPKSALVAIKAAVGTPRVATDVVASEPARAAVLDRADAATLAFSYRYRAQRNVQSDLVALHGDRLALIEVNVAPALQPLARRVMRKIVADWRWTSRAKGSGGSSL
jgi:hypothetical protein